MDCWSKGLSLIKRWKKSIIKHTPQGKMMAQLDHNYIDILKILFVSLWRLILILTLFYEKEQTEFTLLSDI